MTTKKYFILTEAAAMVPLIRPILADVRETRARLTHRQRERSRAALTERQRADLDDEIVEMTRRLDTYVHEALSLGVEITPGVRCEALFPFEHQWTGPNGDGKIRAAYFVFSDGQETITQWFFRGWPDDRRDIWPHWWTQYRNSATAPRPREEQPA